MSWLSWRVDYVSLSAFYAVHSVPVLFGLVDEWEVTVFAEDETLCFKVVEVSFVFCVFIEASNILVDVWSAFGEF